MKRVAENQIGTGPFLWPAHEQSVSNEGGRVGQLANLAKEMLTIRNKTLIPKIERDFAFLLF
jgi:hypothetical protein